MFLKILLHLPFRRYLRCSDHLGTSLGTGDPKITMGPQYFWYVPYHLEITCFLFCLLLSLQAPWRQVPYLTSLCVPCLQIAPGTQQALSKCLHWVRSPSVMGVLRKGWGSDQGSWHPAGTDDSICVGLVVAKSVGSHLQDQEKVLFVKESLKTHLPQIISGWLCVYAHSTWTRMQKEGSSGRGRE